MSKGVALVTGSSRGIGRAIALRLADDGFDIGINDIAAQATDLTKVKAEIESKGRRCIISIADVSLEDQVTRMIQKTVDYLGQLNVMVANAGIVVVKSLLELSVEEWDRVQAINVRGMFLCYSKAAQQMISQGKGGKIIGACSISGYRPSPSSIAYCVSKWAVRGLTQAAAMDLGKHGITVNAYCPGIVNTNMWETIDEALTTKHGLEKGGAFEHSVKERTTLKKAQTPEDIAGYVSFLAGKDSDQMTGQSVIIDGGIVFS